MTSAAQVIQRQRASERPRPSRRIQPHDGEASVIFVNNDDQESVADIIAKYTEQVGEPEGWTDVKILEQVKSEIYRTRLAARDDAKQRGQLVPLADVRARDEVHSATFKSALASVTDLVASLVQPNEIHAAQVKAREWIDKVLSECANALEGK